MGHLRVKLNAVKTPLFVGHAGNRAAGRAGHELEAVGQVGDLVAVAHPDLEHAVPFARGVVLDAAQQLGVAVGAHIGVAKFTLLATLHSAAKLVRHGLHAVTDAQHRQAQLKHRLGCLVGAVLVHTGVAAGQDDALERAITGVGAHPVVANVAGVHLAKHMGFADAAGDQLGDLGPEVQNQDFLMHLLY